MEKQEHRPAKAAAPRVLVCGASFAGLAVACGLNRLGYEVTVIEIARGLRKGGTPVDIEGETIEILTRMGLIEAVRAKALPPRAFEFKAADDSTLNRIEPASAADEGRNEKYEIHRDDLLDILFSRIERAVEIRFNQTVAQLTNGTDSVEVTFDDGSRSDYALVFGCDGNRSRIRRLTFGNSDPFSFFMGGYFLLKVAPVTALLPPNLSQAFSVPGRTALLNGYDDRTDICFAFRTDCEIEYDYRDREQQRRMIFDHFHGMGWKTPTMLAQLDGDEDFYFDKLNQIRMPVWSKGRVALVGDAGYCVSPLAGLGGSMAIIGAARMADALQRHGCDYAAAFKDYEDKLRPLVEDIQAKAVDVGMAMMFPLDDPELKDPDSKLSEGPADIERPSAVQAADT